MSVVDNRIRFAKVQKKNDIAKPAAPYSPPEPSLALIVGRLFTDL